jgi:ribose transport system substrate-binding protein
MINWDGMLTCAGKHRRRHFALFSGTKLRAIVVVSVILTSLSAFAAFAAPAAKPKVLIIYPFLGDQSYVRMRLASLEELKKFPDVDFTVVAGASRTNVDFFINQISNAAAKGYSVVSLNTGGTANQIAPAINKSIADGVKYISFDGAVPDSPGMSSKIVYSNYGAAAEVAREFMKLLPNGGKIGIIRILQGLSDTDAFIDGFKDTIKGSNLEVVAEGDSKVDPAQARRLAENMLTAHPDLVGIYDSVDVSAQGSFEAIKAAKANVVLASIGGQLYAAKYIAAGTQWKFTVPYPFEEMGQQAVDAAHTLATGGKVDETITIQALPPVNQSNAAAWVARLAALGLK